MRIQLTIDYDIQSGHCQVAGLPLVVHPDTGAKAVVKGLCYAALEEARQIVQNFDPNKPAEKPAILVASEVPPVNRINHKK